MKSVHLIISGLVQGVGFRSRMKRQADILKLTGWVKNRPDGAVEAIIVGQERIVNEMLDLCREGPPGTAVETVKIDEITTHDNSTEFKIIKFSGNKT